MNTKIRAALFLVALVAGVVAILVLLDLVPVSDAKELVLRLGGVVGVGYLLVLTGSLLLFRHKQSETENSQE